MWSSLSATGIVSDAGTFAAAIVPYALLALAATAAFKVASWGKRRVSSAMGGGGRRRR